jgi:hypothetical protein
MKLSKLRLSPAMVIALAALFVALGGVGIAANGGNFILGQSNSATSATSLDASVAGGKALGISNTNTAGGSIGLGLTVASGHAPLTVNSSAGKAANLNADKVDGKDASAFLPSTGNVFLFYVGADARPASSTSGVTVKAQVTGDAEIGATTTGSKEVVLSLPAPVSLFGSTLKAKSVQVCYSVSNPASFIDLTVLDLRHAGGAVGIAADTTDRKATSEECYDVGASPTPLDGALYLKLTMIFASTADKIHLGHVQLRLGA